MDFNDVTDQIGTYWAVPNGALYQLRNSETNWPALGRLVSLLQHIDVPEDAQFPRRFVAVLWYMPQFVEWQVPRVAENERHRVMQLAIAIRNELERILGAP